MLSNLLFSNIPIKIKYQKTYYGKRACKCDEDYFKLSLCASFAGKKLSKR